MGLGIRVSVQGYNLELRLGLSSRGAQLPAQGATRRVHRVESRGIRGVVLKKKWGTPETRLRQRFTVT